MASPTLYDHTGRRVSAGSLYNGPRDDRLRRSTVIRDNYNQDISDMVSTYDRQQLTTIGRSLYSNVGPVFGAINEIGIYSVGTAFQPVFIGDDLNWGRDATDWLQGWFRNCDVRGEPYDLNLNLFLSSVCIDRDGDVAVLLTESEDGQWPLLQFIPSHRIGSRSYDFTGVVKNGPYRGLNSNNGVIFNRVGRPVALNILGDDPSGKDDAQISLRDSALIYEPNWFNQGRGICGMAATVSDWRDADTVSYYTKQALKVISSIALVEHNETGSADPGEEQFSNETGSTDYGVTMEEVDAGTVRYFRANSGANLQTLETNRPSVNSQEFMKNYVLRAAFSGLGWPIEFAFDASALTGPSVRLIIGKAERKVEARQKRLVALWRRVVTYALAKAIKSKRLKPSNDWLAWDLTLPRMITIDYGRQSAATIAELKAGITTLSEVCGEDGRDWRQVIRQRAAEQKEILEAASNAGIDPRSIQDLGISQGGSQP